MILGALIASLVTAEEEKIGVKDPVPEEVRRKMKGFAEREIPFKISKERPMIKVSDPLLITLRQGHTSSNAETLKSVMSDLKEQLNLAKYKEDYENCEMEALSQNKIMISFEKCNLNVSKGLKLINHLRKPEYVLGITMGIEAIRVGKSAEIEEALAYFNENIHVKGAADQKTRYEKKHEHKKNTEEL